MSRIVRPATGHDAAAIARICAAIGQSGPGSGADRNYLELLLGTGAVLVATNRAAVVGWGATRPTPAGELLTDLFVDPARQASGIGGSILRRLWPDTAAPARFTFSSQHVNALPLYLRAGLQPVWPLLYLAGPRHRVPGTGCEVGAADADQAAAAGRWLGGGDRAADYRYWARLPGHQPIAVRSPTGVVAAGVATDQAVVHLTCAAAAARDATLAALAALPADKVSCCLPGPHPAVPALVAAGFRPTDYDLAMTTAELRLPTTWVYSAGLG
ncbi:MAG TPA: GNAT family N-acetyltransferase [Jatrophihabitans sp.]|nr:GNAT family N-acetyltransferase [Jatrophihabitans sp.]